MPDAAKPWDLKRRARPSLKRRRDSAAAMNAVADVTVQPADGPAVNMQAPAAPNVSVTPNINVSAPAGAAGAQGPSWKRWHGLITTAADGTFTCTFPVGRFSEAPVMDFQPVRQSAGDTREYSVMIYTIDATACTGKVRRSRTLPAVIGLLTVLISYDPWESPGAPVTLHCKADAAG